jgi:hypothetical protein
VKSYGPWSTDVEPALFEWLMREFAGDINARIAGTAPGPGSLDVVLQEGIPLSRTNSVSPAPNSLPTHPLVINNDSTPQLQSSPQSTLSQVPPPVGDASHVPTPVPVAISEQATALAFTSALATSCSALQSATFPVSGQPCSYLPRPCFLTTQLAIITPIPFTSQVNSDVTPASPSGVLLVTPALPSGVLPVHTILSDAIFAISDIPTLPSDAEVAVTTAMATLDILTLPSDPEATVTMQAVVSTSDIADTAQDPATAQSVVFLTMPNPSATPSEASPDDHDIEMMDMTAPSGISQASPHIANASPEVSLETHPFCVPSAAWPELSDLLTTIENVYKDASNVDDGLHTKALLWRQLSTILLAYEQGCEFEEYADHRGVITTACPALVATWARLRNQQAKIAGPTKFLKLLEAWFRELLPPWYTPLTSSMPTNSSWGTIACSGMNGIALFVRTLWWWDCQHSRSAADAPDQRIMPLMQSVMTVLEALVMHQQTLGKVEQDLGGPLDDPSAVAPSTGDLPTKRVRKKSGWGKLMDAELLIGDDEGEESAKPKKRVRRA